MQTRTLKTRTLNNYAARLERLIKEKEELTAALKEKDAQVQSLSATLIAASGNELTKGVFYSQTTPNIRFEVPVTYKVEEPDKARKDLPASVADTILYRDWKYSRSGLVAASRSEPSLMNWAHKYVAEKFGKVRTTVVKT